MADKKETMGMERMLRKTLVAVVFLSFSAGSIAAQAGARGPARKTYTKEYLGSPGPYFAYVGVCDDLTGANPNLGVVCFRHLAGDYVKVAIKDVSGLPVAGKAVFWDGNDWFKRVDFCGKSPKIPVERWRTLEIFVFVAGPVEAGYWCLRHGDVGTVATKGFVRATFSSR